MQGDVRTILRGISVRQIYLDYNATTPIAPSVAEAIRPFLHDYYGNPSSNHVWGRAAREAIEDARSQVANLIGADPDEVIFTGGGTESNNLAIKGVMLSGERVAGGHLVISAVEHPAVAAPAEYLQRFGIEVTVVGCDDQGRVNPRDIAAALRPDTRMVSVMLANNEVGTIQPIREIADVCHERGVLLHSDAAQCVGKIPVQVDILQVDLLTIAGHKFYGPKGVGALFVRDGLSLEPTTHGADHEKGLRPGTENTAFLVGLGKAASLASQNIEIEGERMAGLRDHLQERLLAGIPGLRVHASRADRLPNTLSIGFPGVTGQELLRAIPELAASTGAACHSGGPLGSATLNAMGVPLEEGRGTVRLSLGWDTSREDIDRAVELMVDAWERLQVHTG